MKHLLLFFLMAMSPLWLFSQQNIRLAQQYFADGEYEKAAIIFKQLHEEQEYNDYYFNQYMECLTSLEKFEEAENTIQKRIKKFPNKYQLYITYGALYEKQYKEDEAQAMYEKSISKINADPNTVRILASSFQNLNKYDLAIQTYDKGNKLLKDETAFAWELADLYRRKGNRDEMIKNYLISLETNPARLNSLKSSFQRYFDEEDYDELQAQLYLRIQDNPDTPMYPELLSWVFLQRKDYKNALRQVKALDRRYEETGARVYNLGQIALLDKDFDTAIKAFQYIVETKGQASSYYIESRKSLLNARKEKIVVGYEYTQEDLRLLEAEYNSFLEEFGRNRITATIVQELADLEAFYLNDLDKATSLLEELVDYPRLDRRILARGKISLANFYLMKEEVWEATLLYSQVDKEFIDDLLGQEARFLNAKLSYYSGDFEWAQTQFNVLKASTSKLIANDALDLSVFIMDNLALDTTAAPLMLYAQADLLVFQNRFEEAFAKLDTLKAVFPAHSLEDDLFYLKAQIFAKQRDYQRAAANYAIIVENYPEGIRADNALFSLAQLYENQLNDTEKASQLYEKLLLEYSGSTFTVEARKRYRTLQGEI